MNYFQTDDHFNNNINKYGCLWFSLMDVAEQHTGHSFIPKTINKLYDHLTNTTFVAGTKEYLLMENDCYINSHTKVLQDALEVFECHDKVKYIGAKYNHDISDRASWGKHKGDYIIIQFKTKNGNGHFRRAHFDPYKPLIPLTNIMSIRYYDIG